MQLNNLHYTLLFLFGVFLLLLAMNPKRPRLAQGYLRFLILGLASAMVLSPFFWLLTAAFKDSDVLMRYTFQPPLSTWGAKSDINEGDISGFPMMANRIFSGRNSEQLTVEKQVWQHLPEAAQESMEQLNTLYLAENETYSVKRDPLMSVRSELEEQRETILAEIEEAKQNVTENTPANVAGNIPDVENRLSDIDARIEKIDKQLDDSRQEFRDKQSALATPAIRESITSGFQSLMQEKNLYDATAFAALGESLDRKKLLAKGVESLDEKELGRLNRTILEDAFPDHVAKSNSMNLDNFRKLFAGEETLQGKVYFYRYILNSLFLACTMTMIQLFFASMGGYALAKYHFRGRNILLMYMLGTMMVPHILLLAPVYDLIVKIGWIDSYLALIVPPAVSVFGVFLFRQAIVGVPNDLIEAARIDGCSEFGIYFRVIMPTVRPMTGAFCLVTFMGAWNAFLGPQIFLHTQAKLTLPVILNQYVGFYQQEYGVFLAGTLLAIIPPAILFFALQKEFISGLTSGAVKG
jgi:ABC-type glycerol-3-phosphate transport system permease component